MCVTFTDSEADIWTMGFGKFLTLVSLSYNIQGEYLISIQKKQLCEQKLW